MLCDDYQRMWQALCARRPVQQAPCTVGSLRCTGSGALTLDLGVHCRPHGDRSSVLNASPFNNNFAFLKMLLLVQKMLLKRGKSKKKVIESSTEFFHLGTLKAWRAAKLSEVLNQCSETCRLKETRRTEFTHQFERACSLSNALNVKTDVQRCSNRSASRLGRNSPLRIRMLRALD